MEKSQEIGNFNYPDLIYISRKDSPKIRGISNEDELAEALTKIGFQVVALSELSVVQQIFLFTNARFIIAPHGAGLSNIIFCTKSNCTVIEINLENYLNNCFSTIAHALGVIKSYIHYICPINSQSPGSSHHSSSGRVEINKLTKLVKEIASEQKIILKSFK